jgi:hypothetical protein
MVSGYWAGHGSLKWAKLQHPKISKKPVRPDVSHRFVFQLICTTLAPIFEYLCR